MTRGARPPAQKLSALTLPFIRNPRIPSVPAGRLWHLVCIALTIVSPEISAKEKKK